MVSTPKSTPLNNCFGQILWVQPDDAERISLIVYDNSKAISTQLEDLVEWFPTTTTTFEGVPPTVYESV